MRSTWDENSKLRDFAVDTKIETVGLTGSLSFKVNDQFSIGGGKQVQGALDAPSNQPCDKRRFFHFYSLLGISKIISKETLKYFLNK
jgi:hypothetical protein